MGSTRSQPHCQKKTKRSHQTLGLPIAYPINKHYSTNTCHKSSLSPNINTSKSITHVENFVHLYSKAEIETLNRAKMCLMIKPKGFPKPSLTFCSPIQHCSRLVTPSPFPFLSPRLILTFFSLFLLTSSNAHFCEALEVMAAHFHGVLKVITCGSTWSS